MRSYAHWKPKPARSHILKGVVDRHDRDATTLRRHPVLMLQQQCGNRCVQRILALSGKGGKEEQRVQAQTETTWAQRAAQGGQAAPKKKLEVDLSEAVLHVYEGSQKTRTMMVIFGSATKRLLRQGKFKIGKWFGGYKTPRRVDYTPCTWFEWGKELARFPAVGKVDFIKVRGRLHPVERAADRGLVFRQVTWKEKQRYLKMKKKVRAESAFVGRSAGLQILQVEAHLRQSNHIL